MSHLHAFGAMTQGELARRVGVSTSGAKVLVDRLENAGIARRTTDTDDRRRVTVDLTSAGQSILDRSAARLKHAMDRIDREKLPTVTGYLRTVADDLTRQAAQLGAELAAQRTG